MPINSPLNKRLLTDPGFIVSASFATGVTGTAAVTASSGVLDFQQASPFPTTERIVLNISSSLVYNTTGSKNINVFVQESADNVTFSNISIFANPLLRIVNAGTSLSSSALSANICLGVPEAKRYFRVTYSPENTSSLSGGPTGSVTATVLF